MNKKFYEAPEMDAIIVNVANTLLAGSPGDGETAPGTGDSEEL